VDGGEVAGAGAGQPPVSDPARRMASCLRGAPGRAPRRRRAYWTTGCGARRTASWRRWEPETCATAGRRRQNGSRGARRRTASAVERRCERAAAASSDRLVLAREGSWAGDASLTLLGPRAVVARRNRESAACACAMLRLHSPSLKEVALWA
jgi:hypothetical protein